MLDDIIENKRKKWLSVFSGFALITVTLEGKVRAEIEQALRGLWPTQV